jgi:hypothetical protein
MQHDNFTATLLVEQTPQEAFTAVLNVRGWWSGLFNETFEGSSEKIGDAFAFRAGDGLHYSKQQLTELVPGKKVAWLVTESNLSFLSNPKEWEGTELHFDISAEGNGSRIVFTHAGLTPEAECYDSCAPAWTQYIGERLKHAITGRYGEQ